MPRIFRFAAEIRSISFKFALLFAGVLLGLFAFVVGARERGRGDLEDSPLLALNGERQSISHRDPTGTLMEPVVARNRPGAKPLPGAAPPEYPTIPATNLPTEPVLESVLTRDSTVASKLKELKGNPRFARLEADIQNGTAVIMGRAERYSDAWDFAQELRRWPQVERVVIDRIEKR